MRELKGARVGDITYAPSRALLNEERIIVLMSAVGSLLFTCVKMQLINHLGGTERALSKENQQACPLAGKRESSNFAA